MFVANFRPITEHGNLQRHLNRTGLKHSPMCPLCGDSEELELDNIQSCQSLTDATDSISDRDRRCKLSKLLTNGRPTWCHLLFYFTYYALKHVSNINISIFRSLRLCWWITTSVVLFSVRCVLGFLLELVFGGVRFAGWSSLQNEHHQISAATKAPTHNELRTRRPMW